MINQGASAPSFTLPGLRDGEQTEYSLDETTANPFDFSPVCTNELCAIRDAEWFQLTPALDVWAISGDSVYAHRAFAEEYGLNFPLLSDSSGRVAESYDVCYDEWENHERVPQRAVFLIDSERTIRYAWATEDALEKPDFFPVKDALETLEAERDELGPEDVELVVEYNEEPEPLT